MISLSEFWIYREVKDYVEIYSNSYINALPEQILQHLSTQEFHFDTRLWHYWEDTGISLKIKRTIDLQLNNLTLLLTSLANVLISARTQSGQSKSPQKRNRYKRQNNRYMFLLYSNDSNKQCNDSINLL